MNEDDNYLDNMLVVCNSQEELRECILLIKDFFGILGFTINEHNDNMCLLQCFHQCINQELCYIASHLIFRPIAICVCLECSWCIAC